MKNWILVIYLVSYLNAFSQTSESTMRPSQWLPIWDKQQAGQGIQILQIGYNDIPRDLNIQGVLVEALEVLDANGTNLIVCCQTGKFPVSVKNEQGVYEKINDRAELSFYHFMKVDDTYKMLAEIHDVQDCDGFDLYNGFTKNALSITDLNKNKVAEISFQITKSCRSDVSPAERKMFFFEASKVFTIVGETTIEGATPAEPVISDALKGSFAEGFLMKKWQRLEYDDFMQFGN